MNTTNTVEEVFFDEALESIENRQATYTYPVVYFGKYHIYFNAACNGIVGGKRIRIYNTTNYIVFIPSDESDRNSFALYAPGNGVSGLQMTIPQNLRNKLTKRGYYKLYKYKNGVCVKKYEPIPDGEVI